MLGPSGSGKTTLLRHDRGLRAAGRRQRADRRARPSPAPGAWVEPEARRIGMVFQQGALFPHLTVAGNVGFGAPARGPRRRVPRAGRPRRPRRRTSRTSSPAASASASRSPARSRADPAVVLLDEPFSALDAGLRERLREEVAAILRAAGTSTLLVTHDQSEALSLADTVAVLRDGPARAGRHARGGLRAPAHALGRELPRRRRRAPGHARATASRSASSAASRSPRSSTARSSSSCGPSRSRSATARRATPTRRPSSSAARSTGTTSSSSSSSPSGRRLRSRRLGFPAWHPGDHVRVWIDGPGHRARAPISEPAGAHRAVEVARAAREHELAVGVGADVRELRDGRLLAPDVLRAALGRAAQGPQRAGAEVAVDVAAAERGQRGAAVDDAAGDGAVAVAVLVGRDGPDELARVVEVVAVDPRRALERAPAEVLRRLVELERHAVDLLDLVLADVADPDLAERGVEPEAPRVAQAGEHDLPVRRAVDGRGDQLAEQLPASCAVLFGSKAPPPSPRPR